MRRACGTEICNSCAADTQYFECQGCHTAFCNCNEDEGEMYHSAVCGAFGCESVLLCDECSDIFEHDDAGAWPKCSHVKCGRVARLPDEKDKDEGSLPGFAKKCPECAHEKKLAATRKAELKAKEVAEGDVPRIMALLPDLHSAPLVKLLNAWLADNKPKTPTKVGLPLFTSFFINKRLFTVL